ncbi:DUF3604 domain-containing protein [Marinobacter panjinensis]|uniref:DUF3604 domain-containing protein n=1 Tax=Marinobacter panjinensis TaxID=2576384 RepID=A0A4U6R563_9GAMM|nr:DUF3604 domain-containing protein [Marinobacter panjinensis]MCR8914169.1 DUF3604 domain-containing protein [Marinobacter panjinensis]TKV68974.1 DUF3604 domain-containing protein [Marinobacter panjinensis]
MERNSLHAIGIPAAFAPISLATLILATAASTSAAQETAHSGDGGTIDPAAISATERLGDRSYSPYASRPFPMRPLWGDQHVHTEWSFDAGFIATVGPEEALQFARGEEVESTFGVPVRLSRPLDWIVMTDHSDSLGFTAELRSGREDLMDDELLKGWNEAMNSGDLDQITDAAMQAIQMQGNGELPEVAQSKEFLQSTWEKYTAIVEEYNEPGRFSAFIGYEWTPNPGPGNNMHRNLVYRDGKSLADQVTPYTTFESVDPEDLWNWMADYEDTTGGRILAIPHNGNLSNGLMFNAEETYSGDPLTRQYAEARMKWEPVYEVTQIKGDGETHPTLSPTDEFADFETWDAGNLNLTPKEPGMIQYEYAREAFKNGLKLERELGTNPFKFGLVSGTDTHTGLSTAEEDNFFGKHSGVEPSAARWEHVTLSFDGRSVLGWQMSAAGYTAVWAEENTRESIWDAMKRREVYASTGPRMTVRFFGGWNFTEEDAQSREPGWVGYDKGVPMGADLEPSDGEGAPTFLVAALRDPIGANLDRIQIIKGWLDADGNTHEVVHDVVWAGDRDIGDDGTLPAVGNTVNVEEASWTNSIGAPELVTVWTDPDFNPDQPAFYYARVIEIPTPRWTAYEAKRFQIEMPGEVPMVTRERAYTSPIWYTPES